MSGNARAPRLRLIGVLFLYLLLAGGGHAQQQHLVAPGDTLFALAHRYGTSIEDLRQVNGLSGSLLRVGQLLDLPGGSGFHFEAAAAGETLADLARRWRLREESLRSANPGLGGPLTAGTPVRIPPVDGVTVRLKEGETLLELAIAHGVPPSELLVVNDLESLSEADYGDFVLLPDVVADRPVPDSTLATVGPGSPATTPSAGPGEKTLPAAVPLLPASLPDSAPDWHARQQQALLRGISGFLAGFEPRADGFIWPLEGRLSSRFGWRNISVAGNRFHGGIDLAVDSGTAVAAAMDGVVVRAGWVGAYGYAVYLDHGDGLQTRYAHLSELLVSAGDVVRQGDTVALAGNTGASTGPHLHFEIRLEGQAVDPLTLVR